MVKKNYIQALSFVLSSFNVAMCYDPFTNSTDPCEMTYEELLCKAADGNCITPTSTKNDLIDCLSGLFTQNASISTSCEAAAESFNITYGTDFTAQELLDLIGGFGNTCGDQEVFDENVAEILAENMTYCLQYNFVGCDESPNGIYPESFNFVETGNGYTCEVNTILFKYFGAENFTMHVGTLCIQTSKRSSDGSFLPPYEASEIMTTACETVQFLTATEFAASNHSLTNQQFKILFIENLNFAMNGLFQNNTGTSISISNGPCSGNIPKSKPKYSILCF